MRSKQECRAIAFHCNLVYSPRGSHRSAHGFCCANPATAENFSADLLPTPDIARLLRRSPCAWSSAGTGTPVPACSGFSTLCVIVRRFHSAAGVLRAALCGTVPARKAAILQCRLVHPPTPFHAAFVVPAQLCPPFDVPADPLASPSPSYFYSIPDFSRFGHSH